jgi:GTP-binding protein
MAFTGFEKTVFLKSAENLSHLPSDNGFEVVFVGRSNAGKSTVINSIIGSNIAKVSKTPGRTRLINYFLVNSNKYLVDLPGFGYAKAPKAIQKQWGYLLEEYFSNRKAIRGVVLIMDIRHPLKDTDKQMLNFCDEYNIPIHILLNKADKISKNNQLNTLREITNRLSSCQNPLTLQMYSSPKKIGVIDLRKILTKWLKL